MNLYTTGLNTPNYFLNDDQNTYTINSEIGGILGPITANVVNQTPLIFSIDDTDTNTPDLSVISGRVSLISSVDDTDDSNFINDHIRAELQFQQLLVDIEVIDAPYGNFNDLSEQQ